MLHNICGRAKSGKTEYLFKICDELIKKGRHTFLIVPEQGAVITEREVIERLGNRSNEYIEVINFKRLCNRVFRETGGLTQRYVDSAHKLLVMHKAISEVYDLLEHYKGASLVSDFVKKAIDTVAEFGMYGVTPEMLLKGADSFEKNGNTRLCAKLRDFALIYAQYSTLLYEKFGYHDSNDDLERLSTVVEECGFFKGKTVIIDSFYGFTAPEMRVIKSMIRDADDVYISYLYDNDEGLLFMRGKKAYTRITELADLNFKETETVFPKYEGAYCSPMLSALEKNFAHEICGKNPVDRITEDDLSVRVIRCDSPYEEAKTCAAIIRYLTSKKGARYSDIAICARSPENYKGILDTTLEINEIPFGFSTRYDLLTRPVSAYILSAFEFSKHKSKQSVLRLIKTGLTPLSDSEADLTECYIRTWNINGRMFTDGEWMMNPDGYTSVEEMSERAKRTLEKVSSARERLITPLVVFDEEIRDAKCANDISRAIVKLLDSSKYNPSQLSSEEIIYHNLVMDALDSIADVIGVDNVSPQMYASLFEMILSEFDTGKIPVAIDEVNVADAELMRTSGSKYVIAIGLCDGVFPRIPSVNGVFSDREKGLLEQYGIELSAQSIDAMFDEMFLAYKTLTTPTNGLFLTYYTKDSMGDEQRSSEIISMCKSAIGVLTENHTSEIPEIRMCLCDESLLGDALDSTNAEYSEVIRCYLEKKGYDFQKLADACFDKLCKETTEMVFSDTLTLSPSRLDKFNHCACSYFAQYTLALKPEPTANLGPSESGTIIHSILENLISELSEKKARNEEITVEYAIARERELLKQNISSLIGSEKAQKQLTKRFKYLYERLTGALDACVTAMTGEFFVSDFTPTDFELSIGKDDAKVQFTPIQITDDDGKISGELIINGKIDRIDTYTKDGKVYLKVLDYKTGTKVFSMEDIPHGINLQMLLYLYSLIKNGKERYRADEIVPSGVVYASVKRPTLSAQLGQELSEDITKSFKPFGIVVDDMEILSAMDNTFSGKYVPAKLKADGSFTVYSSVTSLETLSRMLDCAVDVASKLAGEMKSGKISKNPYKCKECDSCSLCDYLPFCRYSKGETGTRYTMTSYSDEVFEKTCGRDGDGE